MTSPSAIENILPDSPHVGEGRIWDGIKWLKTCPGLETYAMLRLSKENDSIRAQLAVAEEGLIEIAQGTLRPAHYVAKVALDRIAEMKRGDGK